MFSPPGKAGLIRQFSELLHIFIGLFPPLSPRLLQLDQTIFFIHSLPFVLQSTASYLLSPPAVFLPGTLSSSSASLFLLSTLPPPPRLLRGRFATHCVPYDLLYGLDVPKKPPQEEDIGSSSSSSRRRPDPPDGERYNERNPSSVRLSFSFPSTKTTPCSASSYLSLVHSVCSTIATTAGTLSLRFEQRLLSVALMGAAGVFSSLSSPTRTRNAAFRVPSPRLPRQSLLGHALSGFSTDTRKLEPEVAGLREDGGEGGRARGRYCPPPHLRDVRRSIGSPIDVLTPSIFLEPLVEPQTPDNNVLPPPAVSAPFLLKALYRYVLPLILLHLPHLSSKTAVEDGDNKGGGGRSQGTKKRDGDGEDAEKKTKDGILLSVFHQALFAGLHLLQLPPYFQRPASGGKLGRSSPEDSQRLQGSEGQGGERGAEAQGDDGEDEEEESRIFSCFLHLVLLHLICVARGRSVFGATGKQKAAISHLISKESFPALAAPSGKTEGENGLSADDGPKPPLDNAGSIDWRNGTDDNSEIKGDAPRRTISRKESGMSEEERGRRGDFGGVGRVDGGEMRVGSVARDDSSDHRHSTGELEENEEKTDSRGKGEEIVGESERETEDAKGRRPQERKVEKEEQDSREGREGTEKDVREQQKDRSGTRTAGRLFSRIVASALDEELRVYIHSVEGCDSPRSSSQDLSPEDEFAFQKKTVPDSAEIHLLLLLLLRWMSLITANTKEEETRQDRHRRSENKSSEEEGDQRDTRGASRAKEGTSFLYFPTGTDPKLTRRRENLRMVLQGQVYRYEEHTGKLSVFFMRLLVYTWSLWDAILQRVTPPNSCKCFFHWGHGAGRALT